MRGTMLIRFVFVFLREALVVTLRARAELACLTGVEGSHGNAEKVTCGRARVKLGVLRRMLLSRKSSCCGVCG